MTLPALFTFAALVVGFAALYRIVVGQEQSE
jgi:hypothetical protein